MSASTKNASFSVPDGWSSHARGSLIELAPPEADLRLVIADVGAAADARSAARAAWEAYRGKETHSFKVLTPAAGRDGWDDQAIVDYETSPAEHAAVMAVALRSGQAWTVLVVDGNAGTLEKRSGQFSTVLQSLRPIGHQRETFAGRTPHRLDPQRVGVLLDFVREAMATLDVPGVGLGLIDHGKIVYEGGLGVREAGRPETIGPHTRFMVASNTKGMTTLLLARLVDEGKLDWDDPVTKVYPAFRLGDDETTRQVLVRHLVSAFTGLPRKDFEWLFTTTAETPPASTFEQLAATQPTSRFGEVFQYNNLMASAAGFIAGQVVHPGVEVGAAYDMAMQEYVFTPLVMNDTTFSMDVALAGDHASPHGKDPDGKLVVLGMDINNAAVPFRPGGAAWSTPRDMLLYVQNELSEGVLPDGRRFVKPENLLARRARGAPVGDNQWYGMGLMEDATWGVSIIHHGGDLAGYHSDAFAIPSAQVGGVIIANSDSGVFIRGPFMRRVLEVLYDGRPQAADDIAAFAKQIEAQRAAARKRLTIPAAESDVAGLASAYSSPELGALGVERSNGSVRVRSQAWASEVASRRNDDGTVSLVTIDPQTLGLEFVIGARDGTPTLTTRDGQHVYEFVANR
ncbi:MAG TPA: serine hydrolase domain-containing protein [Caulobacteraceae bacterium]|nr:serine hydrolase domain-containing protein [Caulobacteraceae bacterium]